MSITFTITCALIFFLKILLFSPQSLFATYFDVQFPRPVRPGETEEKGKEILSVFDLQNKFIAYTAPVRPPITITESSYSTMLGYP